MYEIRWFAFLPALILAPLTTGVLAGLILLVAAWLDLGLEIEIFTNIVVVAIFLGAPTYLTFGVIGFWYAQRRWGRDAFFWLAGLCANLASMPVLALFFYIFLPNEMGFVGLYLIFGTVFATLWGAIFGWIYRAMVRKGDALREAAHGLD